MPEKTIKECIDRLESQRKGFNKIVQSLDKKIEALDVRVEKMGALHDDHICKAYKQFERLEKVVKDVKLHDETILKIIEDWNIEMAAEKKRLCPEPDIEKLAEVAHNGHYPSPYISWEMAAEDYKENTRNAVRAVLKELGHEREEPAKHPLNYLHLWGQPAEEHELQGHYPDPDEMNQCRVCGDHHPPPAEEESCDNCGIDACMKRGTEGVKWCDEWTTLAEEAKEEK